MKVPDSISNADLMEALNQRGKWRWEFTPMGGWGGSYTCNMRHCVCKPCVTYRIELEKELQKKHGEAVEMAARYTCPEATTRIDILEKWRLCCEKGKKALEEYFASKGKKAEPSPAVPDSDGVFRGPQLTINPAGFFSLFSQPQEVQKQMLTRCPHCGNNYTIGMNDVNSMCPKCGKPPYQRA